MKTVSKVNDNHMRLALELVSGGSPDSKGGGFGTDFHEQRIRNGAGNYLLDHSLSFNPISMSSVIGS